MQDVFRSGALDDNRLDNTVNPDAGCQLVDEVIIEERPGLLRVRVDQAQRDGHGY